MTSADLNGPLAKVIQPLDRFLGVFERLFHVIANLCLIVMLFGTAVTIVLRPINVSYYWIWPWTMVCFVWMSFFGFYVVYRKKKDIAVDFLVLKIGPGAMSATRYLSAFLIMAVTGTILWQMPTILESQVGEVDGAILPWGIELERYALSIPLGVSCLLIFLNAVQDLLSAAAGLPEPVPEHRTDPDT